MPSLPIIGKEKSSNYNYQLNAKRNKNLPLKRYGFLSICQPLKWGLEFVDTFIIFLRCTPAVTVNSFIACLVVRPTAVEGIYFFLSFLSRCRYIYCIDESLEALPAGYLFQWEIHFYLISHQCSSNNIWHFL